MLKTSPICLLSKASKTKSWLWHRRLSHLNFGTTNKLAKDDLARGIPRLKFQKDHLCSACALEKEINPTPTTQSRRHSGPGLQYMTPTTSSSGLIPNPVSQQPCIPPNRDDWDHLFQPMFDDYFTPLPNVVSQVQEVVALRAVDLADSLVSTSIDQDAPSLSTNHHYKTEQSHHLLHIGSHIRSIDQKQTNLF
ncbi:integrase, catalytic region, zinc finger, CCHC-type containing protein [Tanacetum coccineum]